MAWKRFNFFDKVLLAGPVLTQDDKDALESLRGGDVRNTQLELEYITQGEQPGGPYRLLQAYDVCTSDFARNRFVVGCNNPGVAGIIDHNNEQFRRWPAHMLRVGHIQQMRSSDVIVTFGDGAEARHAAIKSALKASVVLGQKHLQGHGAWPPRDGLHGVTKPSDDVPSAVGAAEGVGTMSASAEMALARTGEIKPTLRIWRADRTAGAVWPPPLLREVPLAVDVDLCPPVTAMAVSEDLRLTALGLANGAVVLMRGDFTRSRSGAVSQTTIIPPDSQAVRTAGADMRGAADTGRAVTGLFFARHNDASIDEPVPQGMSDGGEEGAYGVTGSGGSRRILVLYVVTQSRILAVFPGDILPVSMRRMTTMTQLLRRRDARLTPPASTAIEEEEEEEDEHGGESSADAAKPAGRAAPEPEMGSMVKPRQSPGGPSMLLAAQGAEVGCSCVSTNGVLVVATAAGVTPMTPGGVGLFLALGGLKTGIAWANGRLALVTATADRHSVCVFDVRNQLVTLTLTLPLMQAASAADALGVSSLGGGSGSGVGSGGGGGGGYGGGRQLASRGRARPRTHMVTGLHWGWGGALVAPTTEGSVLLLSERSTAQKLASLQEAHRFDVAVKMAKSSPEYGPAAVAEIVRSQGDLAYAERRWTEAATLYSQTIGFVEPSYVVTRFLSASQTDNLVLYLEALHQRGLASAEHTTLLINCYTRAQTAESSAAEASATEMQTLLGVDGKASADDDFDEDDEEEDDDEDDDHDDDDADAAASAAASGVGAAKAGAAARRRVAQARRERTGQTAINAAERKARVIARLRSFIHQAQTAESESEEDEEDHDDDEADDAAGAGAGSGGRSGASTDAAGSQPGRDAGTSAKARRQRRRKRRAAASGDDASLNRRGRLDVVRAIRGLRAAGDAEFGKLALELAVRTGRHAEAVSMWVDSSGVGDATTGLQYMLGLTHAEVEEVVLRYGAVLLKALPTEATDLFIRLCCGWEPDLAAAEEAAATALGSTPEALAAAGRAASRAGRRSTAGAASASGLTATEAEAMAAWRRRRFQKFRGASAKGSTVPDKLLPMYEPDVMPASTPIPASALSGSATVTASTVQRLRLDCELRRLLAAVADTASAPCLSQAASLTLLELSLRPDVGDSALDQLVPVASSSSSASSPPSAAPAAAASSSASWHLEPMALARWQPLPEHAAVRDTLRSRFVRERILDRPERCSVSPEAAISLCRRHGDTAGALRIMGRGGVAGIRAAFERHASLMSDAVRGRRWDEAASMRQVLVEHCEAHEGACPGLWGEALVAVTAAFVGRENTVVLGRAARGEEEDDEDDDEDGSDAEDAAVATVAAAEDDGGGSGAVGESLFLTGTDADDEEHCLAGCVHSAMNVAGMQALQVISVLSSNPRVPLRVVKPALRDLMLTMEEAAVEAEEDSASHRRDTAVMRAELRTLRSTGAVFSGERSRLSRTSLEPPSVHFLCGRVLNGRRMTADLDREHSFALAEATNGDEIACPVCYHDHQHALDVRAHVKSAAQDKAQFFKDIDQPELRGGQFGAVASFLGKCIVEPAAFSS